MTMDVLLDRVVVLLAGWKKAGHLGPHRSQEAEVTLFP